MLCRKLTRVVSKTILSWCVKAATRFSSEILFSPPKILARSLKEKIPMCVLFAKKFPSFHLMMVAYLYGYERFPHFFPSFSNLPIQKQSSKFQTPLQNLPRRVLLSLNFNGKFPCKNMKFFKLNNWMNK